MALGNLKNLKKGGQRQKPADYGIVVDLTSAMPADNDMIAMEGTVVTGSPLADVGASVKFMADKRMQDNLKKGGAQFSAIDEGQQVLDGVQGQQVLLERCTAGDDGMITPGYATTIYSPNKHAANERGFVEGLAAAPFFKINNINKGAGEPSKFTCYLNSDGANKRQQVEGKWETITLDKAFLGEKLKEAQDAGQKVALQVKVFDTDAAIPVSNMDQLADAIKSLATKDPHAGCVVRAFAADALFRTMDSFGFDQVDGEYISNPQKQVDVLAEKGVFRGFSNEDVFRYINEKPGAGMEVIPTKTMRFASDTSTKMIDTWMADPAVGKDNKHTWAFGDKANNLTKVIIPFLKGDNAEFAFNIARQERGYTHLTQVATPTREAAISAEMADKAELTHGDVNPEDGFDDLTLDAALSTPPPQEPKTKRSPAPAM